MVAGSNAVTLGITPARKSTKARDPEKKATLV
jgi:hypothetical protein